MRHIPLCLGAALCCVALSTDKAQADESPKRKVPDYDGRGNPDADAGSWALWIPRIALSPLYAVNEYVVRRPVGWLVSHVERKRWVQSIGDLFRFGPSAENLILPTVLVDFGLIPSVGLYIALEHVGSPRNQVRLRAATGGEDWLSAAALDRYSWDAGRSKLAAHLELMRRPDYLYLGQGPDVTEQTRSRYGLQRIEGSASFSRQLTTANPSSFTFTAGARRMSYRTGGCCGDPTLDSRIADGSLAMPESYGEQYSVLFQHTELMLDSRAPRPASASGVFLRLHGGSATDASRGDTWVNYGAMAGAAVDLTGHQRTLTLTTHVDLVDPVQGVVPFNELVQLGNAQMAGFVLGWMNGRSTFVTEASYRWPVWIWLDGQLRIAAGNAFDEHLDGLAPAKLRVSADVGVTSLGARDAAFEMLFGVGTETIEQGANITSVRLSIGTRQGF